MTSVDSGWGCVKISSLFLVQLPAVTPLSQAICISPILEVPELSFLTITCKPIFLSLT